MLLWKPEFFIESNKTIGICICLYHKDYSDKNLMKFNPPVSEEKPFEEFPILHYRKAKVAIATRDLHGIKPKLAILKHFLKSSCA